MTGIASIPDFGVLVGRGWVYAGEGVAAAVTGSLAVDITVGANVGLAGAGVEAGPYTRMSSRCYRCLSNSPCCCHGLIEPLLAWVSGV